MENWTEFYLHPLLPGANTRQRKQRYLIQLQHKEIFLQKSQF